ncbi:hypothetical protein LTR05_006780 [Lithohypha guttulata]|uniref:TM7S3/TM198-like domain-containing protein n=1 Tax=Lithohypha guttulata TaxID=1690604 RepID=A0AAN7Y9E5_9EURO|nr:hypothetical protein LTR05_006780 [Lithohypha guttulata]
MRFNHVTVCLSYLLGSTLANVVFRNEHLAIRQDSTDSLLPTLSGSASVSTTLLANPQNPSSSASESTIRSSRTSEATTDTTASARDSVATTQTPSPTVSDAIASSTSIIPTTTATPSTNGTSAQDDSAQALPLPPHITPALSIAGVFLVLTGVVYGVIGVKNQWIHVFLSTAYLASVAVVVLIIYVVNPPINNALQGAYFIGVFMSGLIFGGGALVFKEMTEGLGCLLGGFCLSMWFLTLKAGGLVTSTSGKAIFIAVFCLVCWSTSFSHYTRPYGLIFSTSFAGATALVLGIDCFSKGGLKEFWVYLWDLNDDLFPLDTNTYPVTRAIRVEIAIIVIATIFGVISQIRLWKVVQTRQKAREAAVVEDVRRRNAVEEALGRHLERQNDRDRSEWERRYDDRRDIGNGTTTWSEAHGDEKAFASSSITEIGSNEHLGSKESLEMTSMAANPNKQLYSSKSKRQSNTSVHPIQEVEEEDRGLEKRDHKHRSVVDVTGSEGLLPRLDTEDFGFGRDSPKSPRIEQHELTKNPSRASMLQDESILSLRPQNSKPASNKTAHRLQVGEAEAHPKKRKSLELLNDLKRRSIQSLRSRSPMDHDKSLHEHRTESKEALVRPTSIATRSRASSVAATLDEENEKLDLQPLEFDELVRYGSRPPQIVISPSQNFSFTEQLQAGLPSSPSALSESFEADPEAIVRLPDVKVHGFDLDLSGRSAGDTNQTSINENLTRDALQRVPSQTSNVVMSYRTNEWAKHIATADAPIYEEPESAVVRDNEAAMRLVATTPIQNLSIESSTKLESPKTAPAPPLDLKVDTDLQAAKSIISTPTSEHELLATPLAQLHKDTSLSRVASDASTRSPPRRSFTDPVQQAATEQPHQAKQTRRISNPLQRQASVIQHSTIDENAVTDFVPKLYAPKRASPNMNNMGPYQHFYTSQSSSQIDLTRSGSNGSSKQQYPSAFTRSPSAAQGSFDNQGYAARSNSPYDGHHPTALRSETRLTDYGSKSHQPLQRNNTNESRRENMLADWRMQLGQTQNTQGFPQTMAPNPYSQQMLDYQTEKTRKEQQKHQRARQEAALDQTMRTQGMIDAHKEVLKRMQSQANKKLADK